MMVLMVRFVMSSNFEEFVLMSWQLFSLIMLTRKQTLQYLL